MITHPAAELFPLLPDAELQELAEDIKKHGLIEPIVTYEGMLLDGRNRLRACKLAGIEPRFIALDHERESAVSFVTSKNLYRRNLTPSQRAAITADLSELMRRQAQLSTDTPESQSATQKNQLHKCSREKNIEIAAKKMDIGLTSVFKAIKIKKADPDTFNAIKAGTMSLTEGLKKIAKPSTSKPTALPKRATPEWVIAIDEFFENLCANIIRIRKENKDEQHRRRWNPEDVSKRTQTELLDWIEDQLKAGRQLITNQRPL